MVREVKKIPLVCGNAGCEQLVGYWQLFSDYEFYYREQVKRNGTFWCVSCYDLKKQHEREMKKGKPLEIYND